MKRKLKLKNDEARRNLKYVKSSLNNLMKYEFKNTNREKGNKDYAADYNTEDKLEDLQQYRNVVGSVNHLNDLIKSEVNTLCQGRVLNRFWKCTESIAGKRLGCGYYDNKRTAKESGTCGTEKLKTGLFDGIVLMDSDQIKTMKLISCEQREESENYLVCGIFKLLEVEVIKTEVLQQFIRKVGERVLLMISLFLVGYIFGEFEFTKQFVNIISYFVNCMKHCWIG
jgi:hypothetical protein